MHTTYNLSEVKFAKKKMKKCGFMGCTLQDRHAGLHKFKFIRQRRTCKKIVLQNSPSKKRNDIRISNETIELSLIKGRLHAMKKEIDDLLRILT